ncbi:MAG TPA: SulP family inorganic anion transporter [Caulobacteraceae bacterium]
MTGGSASGAARPGPRALPFLTSLRGYQGAFLAPDVLAGLTLAAIAIPEQMATARLGGFAPEFGFFAFIAASLAFAVFGYSRQLSAGADSTITPIFAGGLALLAAAGSPHYAALAVGLALMVGVIVGAAGFLRMGWIGNLLSAPVTLGFLAGIAVHIAVSQLPAALGLGPLSGSTLSRIGVLAGLAPHANLVVAAVTAAVIVVVAGTHALSPRLPGALAAVALASLGANWLHLGDRGLTFLGHVAGGLPRLGIPVLDLGDLAHLAPLAALIALVVMVQTAATARSFPPRDGEADAAGDFIGLGAANVLAGALGAFPVNASPPRTAIAAESGGRTQVTGLVAVAAVLAMLVAGTGILSGIPEAALAGLLLFVAARIVRVKEMVQVFMSSPMEAVLIAATAAGIVVLPIESGVAMGVGLSLLHGLWASARMRVRPMRKIPGASVWWPDGPTHELETIAGVAVVAFQAPLTFLNADLFKQGMLAEIRPGQSDIKLVVLEAAGIDGIDFTAAQAFKAVLEACKAAGVDFALARLESVAAQQALERLGLAGLIGEDHIFETVAAAVEALSPGLDPGGRSPG